MHITLIFLQPMYFFPSISMLWDVLCEFMTYTSKTSQNTLQCVIFLSCPLMDDKKMDVNTRSEQDHDTKGQTAWESGVCESSKTTLHWFVLDSTITKVISVRLRLCRIVRCCHHQAGHTESKINSSFSLYKQSIMHSLPLALSNILPFPLLTNVNGVLVYPQGLTPAATWPFIMSNERKL